MQKALWLFVYGFCAAVLVMDTVDEYARVAAAEKQGVVVAAKEADHGQR